MIIVTRINFICYTNIYFTAFVLMIFTSLLQTVEVFFKLFSQQASQMFKNLIITWIIPSILDGEVGITQLPLIYHQSSSVQRFVKESAICT